MNSSKPISPIRCLVFALVIAVVSSVATYLYMSSSGSNFIHREISLSDARALYANNRRSVAPFGGGNISVSISSDMFDAMKSIERKVPGAGYRCYFAKAADGSNSSIVVRVDAENRDITSYIESAQPGVFSICPAVCDVNGAIVREQ